MVGNNEGSMVPNIFGRGERLTFQFSHRTKEASYGLSFFKPQPGCFERNLTLNLFKGTRQFLWRSLKKTDRGASTEVNHTMVLDTRNCRLFPRRDQPGCRFDFRCATEVRMCAVLLQELAGYTGGDASLLKEDLELQLNSPFLWDFVFSASLRGGMIFPIGDRPVSIADRDLQASRDTAKPFSQQLQGGNSLALSTWAVQLLRGFGLYNIGPQSEGDYLGGDAYWAGGLHLYTPLPISSTWGGLFRMHFFLNAGNLCNLSYGEGAHANLQKLAECIRWSYGTGLTFRLGNIARLELNYCIPMGIHHGG
ncbi:hypothetical protein P4O66_014257, partial [Electrophorus voltai]